MEHKPLFSAVSDVGPLIHLAQTSKLIILRKLFGSVLIISRVERETVDRGIRLGHQDALIIKQAIDEGWVRVKDIAHASARDAERLAESERISKSDAETLLLARETRAEVVLIDEKVISDLARMFGLRVWNTWALLLEALSQGFISVSDVESAIEELGERRHKLKPEQAAEILEAAKLIASTRRARD